MGDQTREQLQKQFKQILEALNPQQYKAVQRIEGPTLVVAGPGTGKTHLVATRIANILIETDTPAGSILCLTYSDAGATAMRKRLIQIIGAEAHKIHVSTFHAFCSRVISDHPELFGRGREMQLLSDLERSQWIEELIQGLPTSHLIFRRFKSTALFRAKLSHLFTTMKREKWTSDYLIQSTDTFLAEIPTNPDYIYRRKSHQYKPGDLKVADIQEITDKLNQFKAGVHLFPKWQQILASRDRYEYDDMITWVVDALEKHRELKQSLQERYLYLIADEFQDTNAGQNKILQLLSDYWEAPNVFIVGDDDQSIYEFQGARLQNLVDFYQLHAESIEAIVLEQNYRSSQQILDTAKKVIGNNVIRALPRLGLGNEKHLYAAHSRWSEVPELRVFRDEYSELTWVIDTIEEHLEKGVQPEEIAVIYRNNKEGERVVTLLRERNIPFYIKKDVSILEISLIQQITQLIEWITEQLRNPLSSDGDLFILLHAPFWYLKPLDLAQLMAARKSQNQHSPLRVLLQDEAFVRGSGVSRPEQILDTMHDLEQLISSAASMPLLQFWNHLLKHTKLLYWCTEQTDSVYWTQVLHTLNLFLQTEVQRQPTLHIKDIPALLKHMRDLKLKVPLIQTAQMQTGVQLLTAHASKGLEFEVVFMINCTKSTWEDGGSNKIKFTFPPNVTLSGEEDSVEAQRRLFYVAMTRAKRWLYISYASRNSTLKDQLPCKFVHETGLQAIEQHIEPDQIAATQLIVMGRDKEIKVEIPKSAFIKAWAEQHVMSITGMNLFLQCPLAFYYERILRVPNQRSEAALFGTLIHAALELYFEKRNAAKHAASVGLNTLKAAYRSVMEQNQHFFSSTTDYRNKREYGLQCLEAYYHEHHLSWNYKSQLEKKIDHCVIDGVPVNGVIDRLDRLDSEIWRVIDYKTGAFDKKKFRPPTDEEPLGGDYYRQGLFYKLIADASSLVPGHVTEVVFSFVERGKDDKHTDYAIEMDRESVDWMRKLLVDTYAQIQSAQFETGCGKPTCTYCNFYRSHELDDDRLDQITGLDDE